MTKTDVANFALSKIGEQLISDITDTGQKAARLCNLHFDQAMREVLREHFWTFATRVLRRVPIASDAYRVGGTLTWVNPSNGITSTISVPIMRYKADVNSRAQYQEDPSVAAPAAPKIQYDGAKWVLTALTPSGATATWNAANGTQLSPDLANWATSAVSPAVGVPVFEVVADPEILGFSRAFELPSDFCKLEKLMNESGQKIDRFEIRRVNNRRCVLTVDHDWIALKYVANSAPLDDWCPLFTECVVTLLAAKLAEPIKGEAKLKQMLLQEYHQVNLPAARTTDSHDQNSNENHPLKEFLEGSLTNGRVFFDQKND